MMSHLSIKLKCFILFLICIILISCESPNEIEPPNNNLISINISMNDSIIYLGDTLKISIRVESQNLFNGSINFGDSNSVIFSDLKNIIDTTLIHIFNSVGKFKVSASFSNGDGVILKEKNVEVIPNPNFYVLFNVNKTILVIDYDTLEVNIKASDSSLLQGSLDFDDGTIISFTDINQIFDTTITHVYRNGSVGLKRLKTSFTNKSNQTILKENEVTVYSNFQPSLGWMFNSVNLNCGDTLSVYLHASDMTLSNGFVDFKDGTLISFDQSNYTYTSLNYILDTTIYHVYSQAGDYLVTSSFTDGINYITKEVLVKITPKPLITITLSSNNIVVGDTLKVNLHSSSSSFLNGMLDFKDGTIISFSNVGPNFDTTISHLYSQPGEYLLTTLFDDGNTSTIINSNIIVKRYYELSFQAGMKWLYSYNSSYSAVINGMNERVSGTREWEIISVSNNSLFNIRQIKNESIHTWDMHGYDTTYTVNDTTFFTFIDTYNTIKFNIPFPGSPFTIPNHSYVNSYPLKVGQSFPEAYIWCEDIVGITKYKYRLNLQYSTSTAELLLLEFILP